MQKKYEHLLPNYDSGRFFVSPILGCSGGCRYCYLPINNYSIPRKNDISILEIKQVAEATPDFLFGRKGTIISIGAWGDIFPKNNIELCNHSVNLILELLKWNNPIQIMSKYAPSNEIISKIVSGIQYEGQLLYSTTVTTIIYWDKIEPNTSSPIDRLNACKVFKQYNVPTNVMIKPFIEQITSEEIENIADIITKSKINFCVIGVLYHNAKIQKKLNTVLDLENISNQINHLDCNGKTEIASTSVTSLIQYVKYFRSKGINTFAKSSCVNANILGCYNPSGYFTEHSEYCVLCGNCREKTKI